MPSSARLGFKSALPRASPQVLVRPAQICATLLVSELRAIHARGQIPQTDACRLRGPSGESLYRLGVVAFVRFMIGHFCHMSVLIFTFCVKDFGVVCQDFISVARLPKYQYFRVPAFWCRVPGFHFCRMSTEIFNV